MEMVWSSFNFNMLISPLSVPSPSVTGNVDSNFMRENCQTKDLVMIDYGIAKQILDNGKVSVMTV